ncbi:MAG: type I DNA topoisomerase [Proteobacteria bacterium]|nr:type I DNA topoisomerase [Pseudomonadota bacterium]
MSKPLLIVESPAKARTIKRYLGGRFKVEASVGHIRDLPVRDLGVDIERDFSPQYVTIKGKEKVIKNLKKAAEGVTDVYLAPDPDREGEAIAWHIAQAIGDGGRRFHRVLIHEMTKDAILKAIEDTGELDANKFDSQQTRRVLDRLVGYLVSPLLWDKVKRGLSAGRVQSVAVRMVVEREREIWAFKPQEYWSVTALLDGPEPPPVEARVVRAEGKKLGPHDIATQDQAHKMAGDLKKAAFVVAAVAKKDRRRQPAPPFITSTLQQEAARKLRLTAKQTMALAQRLYEGVEMGSEDTEGLITYMRTDSVRLAPQAVAAARQFITGQYGAEYLPPKPPAYRSKKSAQEAHEAIRPTSVDRPPEAVAKFLDKRELDLYRLIWNRFIASQMKPALLEMTTVDIEAGPYVLRATGSVVKFDGFMRVYVEDTDALNNHQDGSTLPPLAKGDPLKLKKVEPKQHFTQPPPRYTEASLIKKLEEEGVGRPSTYAAILSTIQDKEYVAKIKAQFRPTEMGLAINDLLVQNFPDIFNVSFTARMEGDLDKVEDGVLPGLSVLQKFYTPFETDLAAAKEAMRLVKAQGLPTDRKCPQCEREVVIKFGRQGPFLACTGYPECKFTSDFERDEDGRVVPRQAEGPRETELTCPECGRTLVVKQGKRGPFLACPGYPECKYTSDFQEDEHGDIVPVRNQTQAETTGLKCEKCGADMVIRRGRRGEFMACSGYPKCRNAKDFVRDEEGRIKVADGAETDEACPNCGRPMAVKKGRWGPFLACTGYPECKTTKKMAGEAAAARTKQPPAEPIMPCPEEGCDGQVVVKTSRRGKTFYGCNRYPKCKLATWSRPVDKPCPECGAKFLVQDKDKQGRPKLKCDDKDCGYTEGTSG